MKVNFDTALGFTLGQEGGWSDNPNDPGGPTMAGVTLITYRRWAGQSGLPEPDATDLAAIDRTTLAAIYGTDYWAGVNGDELPTGVDLSVFDMGVNAGPGRAVRQLQAVVGVTVDGMCGPETLAAVADRSVYALLTSLASAQTAYYRTCSDFVIFGMGWLRRVQARRSAALALISLP